MQQHALPRSRACAPLAWIVCGLLLIVLAGPIPAAAQNPGFVTLPRGDVLRVTLPDKARIGLVLLLPDALGGDTRSLPYVEQLLAEGIAVAEPQWQRSTPAEQAHRALALLPLLPELAEALEFPPAIGLAGFGLGGRAALLGAASRGWPAAALYPGCGSLLAAMEAAPGAIMDAEPPVAAASVAARSRAAPVLLLHGSADAAEPQGACATLVARLGPGAERHEYFGATYAWDYEAGPWENMAALLPAPEGEGPRRRAHRSSGVTADSAFRVAHFLARQLLPAAREAAR